MSINDSIVIESELSISLRLYSCISNLLFIAAFRFLINNGHPKHNASMSSVATPSTYPFLHKNEQYASASDSAINQGIPRSVNNFCASNMCFSSTLTFPFVYFSINS
ncbi:hypothetical protein A0H76_1642 [Hepatospora eriocheir]|uniref:Uncharacterized protein n=1 Tax=Hepatospora eriocheir TaxID=1081669 RepID=A0A1X0Q5V7_9MICR|nr:hypothetical protein A0H76_1642 [Hepatospora eriocheir]